MPLNLNDYFIEAIEAAQARYPGGWIRLRRFNNINELGGEVDAIINAANTTVTFGGGISGDIGAATGRAGNITNEARGHIGRFNRLIRGEERRIPDAWAAFFE